MHKIWKLDEDKYEIIAPVSFSIRIMIMETQWRDRIVPISHILYQDNEVKKYIVSKEEEKNRGTKGRKNEIKFHALSPIPLHLSISNFSVILNLSEKNVGGSPLG